MPWANPRSYEFNRLSVLVNAPELSGVYALFTSTTWVYVGESWNVRARLIQHLNGDNACITLYPDLTFSFELAPEPIRQWRQEELISELRPACNPRSG